MGGEFLDDDELSQTWEACVEADRLLGVASHGEVSDAWQRRPRRRGIAQVQEKVTKLGQDWFGKANRKGDFDRERDKVCYDYRRSV